MLLSGHVLQDHLCWKWKHIVTWDILCLIQDSAIVQGISFNQSNQSNSITISLSIFLSFYLSIYLIYRSISMHPSISHIICYSLCVCRDEVNAIRAERDPIDKVKLLLTENQLATEEELKV